MRIVSWLIGGTMRERSVRFGGRGLGEVLTAEPCVVLGCRRKGREVWESWCS